MWGGGFGQGHAKCGATCCLEAAAVSINGQLPVNLRVLLSRKHNMVSQVLLY